LWLQIKSKLLAGETGSEPGRRINFTAFFRPPYWRTKHFCLTAAADIAVTGLPFFASRLEDVGNIPSVARFICHPLVLEGKNRIDHEPFRRAQGPEYVEGHEHDYDYDYEGGGEPK
jgi:hypothetical protein